VLDGQGATRVLFSSETDVLTVAQKKVLEINRRTQRQNNAPPDFPSFLRDGYDMTIVCGDGYQAHRCCGQLGEGQWGAAEGSGGQCGGEAPSDQDRGAPPPL
jgi:hypothetical protein